MQELGADSTVDRRRIKSTSEARRWRLRHGVQHVWGEGLCAQRRVQERRSFA